MTAASSTRRVDLCALDDVPPGTMKLCEVGDDLVLVVNLNGELHATQGICSHQYFELDKGFLTGDSVTCALHLSRFSLADGEPLDPPGGPEGPPVGPEEPPRWKYATGCTKP